MQKTIIESNGRSHSLVKFGPQTHLGGQLIVTDPLGQSAIVIYDANGNLENFILLDLEPGFDWYDYQMVYDPNLDQYYIADTKRVGSDFLSLDGFGVANGNENALYLAALDNQGQVLWYHESENNSTWTLGDIILDDNGDIYFTGEYNHNNHNNNGLDSFAGLTFTEDPNQNDPRGPFLVKLDPSVI